MWFIRNFT